MRRFTSAACLGILFAIGGCSGAVDTTPGGLTGSRLPPRLTAATKPPADSSVAPDETLSPPPPLGDDSSPLPKRLVAKSGRDYAVLFEYQPTLSSGAARIFQGLTATGEVVASQTPAPSGEGLMPLTVELMSSEKSVGLHGPQPDRQIIATATSGETVAWMQTSSTSLYEANWEIYISEKGSQARLLADSDEATKGKVPRAPEYIPLSTDGKRVYWTAPYLKGDRAQADIMVASTGSSRSVFIYGAKLPAATNDGLFYVRSADVSPGFTKGIAEVRFKSGSGKSDQLIARVSKNEGSSVGALCASSSRLAWTVANTGGRDSLVVQDRRRGKEVRMNLNNSAGSTSLACGSNFVAWGGGSGTGDSSQYVWPNLNKPPLRLSVSPGRAIVYAAGPYVAWWHESKGSVLSAVTVARVLN